VTVAPRETRGIQWLQLIALGAAVAILPLGTDIVVPTLPLIAAAFASGAVGTQQLLRAFVLGFGIAHVFVGRLLDRCGTRTVLTTAMLLLAGTTAASALAPTLSTMTGARLLQGALAAVAPIAARAIMREH
jgi:DHA1 family bicyclomycin/chloramphenicol resistance-like MFS transporter